MNSGLLLRRRIRSLFVDIFFRRAFGKVDHAAEISQSNPTIASSMLLNNSCPLIDRLPDELLLQIFKYIMKHDGDPPYFLQRHWDGFWKWDGVYSSQKSHCHDWWIVIGTCRRIRNIGMECFFNHKTIVMTLSGSNRLRSGTFLTGALPDCSGMVESQAPVLRWTRSLVVTASKDDISASGFLQLAGTTRAFTYLRECTFVFGYGKGTDLMATILAARSSDNIPTELRRLLHKIRVPRNLELHIAACEKDTGPDPWARLDENVYPMLKCRARLLAKSRRSS